MANDTAPQPQTQNPRGRTPSKGRATTPTVTPPPVQVTSARELYREALAARLGLTGRLAGDLDEPSAGDLLLWTLGGGAKASELWEAMFALADELNATADLHCCLGLEEPLPVPVVSRLAGLAERARILGRLHCETLERMGAIPVMAVRSSEGGAK